MTRTVGRGAPLGQVLAHAIAAGDFATVGACYEQDARVTASLPSRVDEYAGRAAVVAAMTRWFADAEIEVLETETRPVVDLLYLRYLLRVVDADGEQIVEQHQYAVVTDDRITAARLLCSGFRPLSAPTRVDAAELGTRPGDAVFDAGTLGCTDGLASAFKQRLEQVPVGGALVTVARDPSAPEELPALARLLGHDVDPPWRHPDGSVSVRVTRTH